MYTGSATQMDKRPTDSIPDRLDRQKQEIKEA